MEKIITEHFCIECPRGKTCGYIALGKQRLCSNVQDFLRGYKVGISQHREYNDDINVIGHSEIPNQFQE